MQLSASGIQKPVEFFSQAATKAALKLDISTKYQESQECWKEHTSEFKLQPKFQLFANRYNVNIGQISKQHVIQVTADFAFLQFIEVGLISCLFKTSSAFLIFCLSNSQAL